MIDFWEKTSTAGKKIRPKQKLNNMAEEFDFSHLSPEKFHVLREAGTERAWSGEYNKHYSKGNYNCRGCRISCSKVTRNSTPVQDGRALTGQLMEASLNWRPFLWNVRVEVQCSRCKSHLRHVFPDGPRKPRSALLHEQSQPHF